MNFILVALFIFLTGYGASATGNNLFDESIDQVANYINENQKEGQKIALVLGALPSERSNFKFDLTNGFEEEPIVIYVNDSSYTYTESMRNPKASNDKSQSDKQLLDSSHIGQLILTDFNNLTNLNQISKKLDKIFDLITLDCSVSKFMKLTNDHFMQYQGLLSSNGKMVFDYLDAILPVLQLANGILNADLDSAINDFVQKNINNKTEFQIKKIEEPVLLHFQNRILFKSGCLKKLSEKYILQYLNEYNNYVDIWKSKNNFNTDFNLNLTLSKFPYWTPTGRKDRDGWIADPRPYFEMEQVKREQSK
jgi:hypothetical protein